MESNQELMILSLLNLYMSYKNLKRKSAENNEKNLFFNRCATKRLQTFTTVNKEHHISNKRSDITTVVTSYKTKGTTLDHGLSVYHNASASGSRASCINIDVTTDKKEKSIGDGTHVASRSDSYTNDTLIDDTKDSTTKKTKKRRRRGAGKTTENPCSKPRKRRWRVRPINIDRVISGYHRKVFLNIKKMNQQQFFEHTRMSKTLFDWLLTFAHSSLRKKRQSIFAEERLAITLNYLAHGTPLQSIAWKYKVGKSTARLIVLDTCSVLFNLLSPLYLSDLTTAQYADIAEDFKRKWEVPNCVGAVGAKYVSVRDPSKSAPLHNKVNVNMLVLGVCDTKYKFSAVTLGNVTKQSDDGILQLLSQHSSIVCDSLPLPASKPLFTSSAPFPHFFISGTFFPLRRNVMRPYVEADLNSNKTIFNYKISRARTVTENTFGILTARFRVLSTTIEFLPENCKTIILACIVLHNFIMTNDEEKLYCPANFVDRENESGIIDEGEWRNELKKNGDQPLLSISSNDTRSTYEAINLRDTLANFFASDTISYEIEIL